MSNADSCSTSPLTRLFPSKTIFVLSFIACMSFTTPNKTVEVGNTYAYENRTADMKVMQLREWVTGYAQNFTGIHYRYAGRSPKTGFDCSGFTSYILGEFDLKASCSSATQSKQGERISLDEVLPGDLVFFGSKSHIQHVALVVECSGEGIICVHSTCSRGVVVENISTSKYWKPRILFARDIITGQKKTCSEIVAEVSVEEECK